MGLREHSSSSRFENSRPPVRVWIANPHSPDLAGWDDAGTWKINLLVASLVIPLREDQHHPFGFFRKVADDHARVCGNSSAGCHAVPGEIDRNFISASR